MKDYTVCIKTSNASLKNHFDLYHAMKIAGFSRLDQTEDFVLDAPEGNYHIFSESDLKTVTYIARFVASSALSSDDFELLVSVSDGAKEDCYQV